MEHTFGTANYEFTHGRKPRGTGCWAFIFHGRNSEAEFAPGTLAFSQAKAWARTRATQLGVRFVEVAT